MFLEIQNHPSDTIALVDDSKESITHGELITRSKEFFNSINKRTCVFILSDNSLQPFIAYYSCLENKVVPLLLNSNIDFQLLEGLIESYQPEFLFLPNARISEFSYAKVTDFGGYSLVETGFATLDLHTDLAMLLPTSGSTGSPKLVRHSYENLEFSASKVVALFSIKPEDNAIAFLPMYYTMGLSVINSHLKAGAKVVLTNLSLTDRVFWDLMKNERISNFTGVPYSFEILDKLRFYRMNLPDLEVISQGGGKLKESLFEKFASFAIEKDLKFIPTYGQTEGSARMAYLPHEKIIEKQGSIGKAIPEGYLGVIDESGNEIISDGAEAVGEMIYKGKNVTLGYANNFEDLVKGDENHGVLHTGDIVRRDKDGYFFIIGRKKRFLKLFGLRVSLDEIELIVKGNFDLDCVCTGSDDKLMVWITDEGKLEEVKDYVSAKTGIFRGVVQVSYREEIKRNATGKVILSDFD